MKKIIIDTLGADNGSAPIISGALRALKELPDLAIVFTGVSADIERMIAQTNADASRISILHTEAFVPDDALPTYVFRGADDTSMVMSLEQLKNDDTLIGMISAGNTGALLVGSIFRLGLVASLRSPALATAIPCKQDGNVCLVDCGANTDCTAEDLKRFAVMGNAFMQALEGTPSPKVALMSVGRTPGKGNALVKEAYPLLESLPLNFIGNIEGNDLVNAQADVIVTDGFTGNVLLKNTEAAGMAALSMVEAAGADLPQYEQVTEQLRKRFAFNDRGGAVFLGTAKTVVKMHGCANADTAYACVNLLLKLESRNCAANIAKALQCM